RSAPALQVNRQREEKDGEDDRNRGKVGAESERLPDHLRDSVKVIAVFIGEDDGSTGNQGIPCDQDQRQPVRAAEDGGRGCCRLRRELDIRWPGGLAHPLKRSVAEYRLVRLGHRG